MKLLNKIFGGIKLTWLKLVILSVAVGVLVGLIMITPALKDNAIRMMGVSYEAWIILAVFVVSNCSKTLEAGLKCFVFFLISQPLIYLVQQPFASVNLIATYYFPWFIATLFTFPGGMIAFQIKRKNILSAIILSVAGAALACLSAAYIADKSISTGISFVVYGIIGLVFVVLFAFIFCKGWKEKIIYFVVVAAAVAFLWVFYLQNRTVNGTYEYTISGDGTWSLEEGSFADSNIDIDGNIITITYMGNDACGEFNVSNEDGEKKSFTFVMENGEPKMEEVTE